MYGMWTDLAAGFDKVSLIPETLAYTPPMLLGGGQKAGSGTRGAVQGTASSPGPGTRSPGSHTPPIPSGLLAPRILSAEVS